MKVENMQAGQGLDLPVRNQLFIGGRFVDAESGETLPTLNPHDNSVITEVAMAGPADVDKATKGSVKITVHSAGSLIKHPEIKRAVRQGTAPIGEILESLSANEAPVYGIDSLPFLATGYDASKKLYNAQKPYLEKQLASEGLVFLYSVPWPPQGIYAKREINSVDELKGLKEYLAKLAANQTLAPEFADANKDLVADTPTDPAKWVKVAWPKMEGILRHHCEEPADWPAAFGFACQEVMQEAKSVIEPCLALRILMESAIPMSKVA